MIRAAVFDTFEAMNARVFLLVVVFFFKGALLHAQDIRGRVLHAETKDPIAFVTVAVEGTSIGTFSDIDGYFRLNGLNAGSVITLSYLGFQSSRYTVEVNESPVIYLAPKPISMREVVIVPGENPAEAIMRKVIRNRDSNNPEKSLAFTYESYNKLVLTGKLDSLVTMGGRRATRDTVPTDSLKKAKDFLADKHLFLMESASNRKHLPPDKDEETVVASRVSGFRNPTFALLGTQLQSFSLYGETFSILDITYLSPTANEAIRKYLFILEDTLVSENDSVFIISFRPRKNSNFKGMSGQLFISNDGWAVKQLTAIPADSSDAVKIRIQQQYTKQSSAWFPEQLNSFLEFPTASINGFELMGESKSYIRNIDIKPDLRKRDFGPVVLRMDPQATRVPDSLLERSRIYPLDEREARTYAFIDSLGQKENFEKKLKILTSIATGRIPMGKFDWELNRIIRFNEYEGFRLGAGLRTNDFLSDKFSIGGYYGYGFRDEAHKFGGDLIVHLKRKRNLYFKAAYQEDVVETGGHQLDSRTGNIFQSNYYPLLISRMDRIRRTEFSLHGRMVGNLTGTLSSSYQKTNPFETVGFRYPVNEESTLILREYDLMEAGVLLRWAPGEKLVATGTKEVSLGSKWPVFYGRFTYGGVAFSNINIFYFNRYDLLAEKTFRSALYGNLSLHLHAGMVDGSIPSNLYYNARGSNTINFDKDQYLGISAPYTFETMRVNEFLHSEYVAFHLRHSFRDLLFTSGKFRPRLTLVHNSLFGRGGDQELQLLTASVAEKGFHESGICIDRLLSSGFSAFGIGAFYRYGAYAFENSGENVVVKLSVSFDL